ncbi:MAG TPA: hypothetical protein VFH73_22205, partial [Polyangia bacterium]|nr:hypothetical protein [Polyangia bacterium]
VLALSVSAAVTVAAPDGPDFGCPSPRQVTAAMVARSPTVVAPIEQAPAPGLMQLMVTGGGAAGPMRIDLVDDVGEPRLRRLLPAEAQGNTADCAALAETVALIVDRFLHDVGSPPATSGVAIERAAGADAPTFDGASAAATFTRIGMVVAGGWRGAATASGPEVTLGFDVLRRTGRIPGGLTLTGGVASAESGRWSNGTASLRRLPLRLGIFVSLPVGVGRLEPGIGLGTDVLLVSSNGAAGIREFRRSSPGADAGVGYRLPLGRHFFARVMVTAGVALPYQFNVPGGGTADGSQTVLATPRIYARSGLELGTYFR